MALQVFAIDRVFLSGQMSYLEIHRTVGLGLGVIAILAVVGSLSAQEGWRVSLSASVLFTLYILQYTFIDARNGPIALSFHAVNALVLFWLALKLARRATLPRSTARSGV